MEISKVYLKQGFIYRKGKLAIFDFISFREKYIHVFDHSKVCVARYLQVYSSHPRMWKLYPLILMSPPTGNSHGVMNSLFLSTFLYFLLSKNGPSIIPEFFWAGSKIEIVSSAK